MKRLLLFFCGVFICTTAIAHTINWYVGGNLYHTTTCESGEDVTPPTAPEKYGYTFMGWSLQYISVEYIEGLNNVQYIDTGIIPNSTMSIYAKVSASLAGDYYAALGARQQHQDGFDFFVGNNSILVDWFGTSEETRYEIDPNGVTEEDIFEIKISDNTLILIKNQSELGKHTFVPTNQTKYTIFLNGINDSSKPHFRKHSTGRIYHFKIEGVADMWPVRRMSDGTVGMYDTIRQQFFTNAGIGNFIAGPTVGE